MPALYPTTDTTILVVEDDDDTREFFVFLLADTGYHVLEAASGAAALAHVAAQPINAVLLDRRLPDMDGLDVCRHVRAGQDNTVPIIMVTADRDPELEAMALAAGATALLHKPVLPNVLLGRLALTVRG